MNVNTLRNYEQGLSLPNSDILALICAEYGLNPAWLLLGEGPMNVGEQAGAQSHEGSEISSIPAGGMDALWKENRDLRQENRELRQENRALLKENADLRVAVAELKPRGAPSVDTTDEHDNKAARKSA
ncbi:MAG: hypothetical protein HY795_04275 [Desulfovibrio sp.]|nr:hypothetical protein [Desulfovibrio sp.]MBI4959477.1 hypothetical protein [Desulfovibrio sp.]